MTWKNESQKHSLASRGIKTKDKMLMKLSRANNLIRSGKVKYMGLHSGIDVYDEIDLFREKFKIENIYVDVMGVEDRDDNLIILSVIPLTKQIKHSIMMLYKKNNEY